MASHTHQHADLSRERLLEQLEEFDRQLRATRNDLDRAQRLATLGTIAGSIAHEFNNILTPVLSYAQMALGSPEDRDLVNKALCKAVEGSERASKIAAAMLGFLRGEGAERVAVVSEVIQQTLSCLGRDPARDGVRMEIVCPEGVRVAAPPVSLQQILMNLILNAIEAMKPGGGVLTLTVSEDRFGRITLPNGSTWNTCETPLLPSAPGVLLVVRDTGRGMTAQALNRAFEPLVAHAESNGRRGHGLGLSVCKRLTEEAGGAIALESRPGEGCIARVFLPRAEPTTPNRA